MKTGAGSITFYTPYREDYQETREKVHRCNPAARRKNISLRHAGGFAPLNNIVSERTSLDTEINITQDNKIDFFLS